MPNSSQILCGNGTVLPLFPVRQALMVVRGHGAGGGDPDAGNKSHSTIRHWTPSSSSICLWLLRSSCVLRWIFAWLSRARAKRSRLCPAVDPWKSQARGQLSSQQVVHCALQACRATDGLCHSRVP